MKNKFVLIAICFLCFGFILFNSSQVSTVSNTRSREVVNEVIKVASKTKGGQILLSKVNETELNLVVRKIAHAFEFFLLGIVLCFTFRYFKIDDNNLLIYTLFTVLFVAVIDEFFQIFIQNRTSSVVDVLIDFGGGILANTLFFIFSSARGKHYKKTTHMKRFVMEKNR
ncbi:VanZ family protein [Clostridium butyricum]|uniref:VanZ family protein n=1 Tax=Clostridium butyricum TaxID=1492 RepID=UPI00071BEC4A|nr:VanZ family protein [Clostridium butyricum]ALP91640.1 teicoplanin resistance protein VanZ [Clostridium butyricum]ALS18135.1 teicoplanin resistance protein VanZ [Clostridium butyricum]ANF15260.1 teicoplanin resistance protein VanZ [Clostridium butyricum]AOR95209.1 teicoplanin resistance protein VanZ [Clostridium butyricum]MCI3009494.1 VanZ family protein [Clostridium butyricum]